METSLAAAGAGSYASKAAGKRNNADFDPFDRAETQKKVSFYLITLKLIPGFGASQLRIVLKDVGSYVCANKSKQD